MVPKPSDKRTLQQTITHRIRKKILSGHLTANSHLNEANVAEMLGVSRSPVREAIKTLESEGLLKTLSTGRTIVIGFTPKDLADLYELRFDLEWKSMQALHKRGILTVEQWIEIEKVLQLMEQCTDYHGSYIYLDTMFHRKVVEAASNRPLFRIWSTMIQTITALQEITNEQIDQPGMNELTQMHRDIFQSIRGGEAKTTKALLHKHIQAGVDIVTRVLEESIARNIETDWLVDFR
ncbi:GntR family transcriptional regulator [Paenibacillus spongiae]|uniref:GntR family transcriptional regulator n=1 Tax=Paenibacillus spongiae TaxID=2909671 RepID=A0ABY5S363_9BACL|nr:GntR family transcriptional regulator [Paenibacillus spongiae]UVI28344.1 GntR family transcriptional regulator [Paenibacillus spongiae]